jgi:spore coat protein H
MKELMLLAGTILFLLIGCDISDNNPANDINSIPLFHTYIEPENLSELLANKLVKHPVPIKIFLNDVNYTGVIEAQGSGSRYLPKWSYEIILSKGTIINLKNFNLSAQVGDPSMLKTTLASFAYKEMGFNVFDSELAFLKINDQNKGLYYVIERIEEDFFNKRNIPVYELIKTMLGAKFTFAGSNNLYEYFEKEIGHSDNLYNFENFINTLDTVSQENISGQISNQLDILSYLKYHAVSTIIAAKDGFRNNIIFFKRSPKSPYETLPWDFDGTFNPLFTEIFYGDNEIIYKLLQNNYCFNLYKQYYTYFLENLFNENTLFPIIDQTIQKIRTAYDLDPYLGEAGYSLEKEANELKDFIALRRQLLLNNLNNFKKP